MNDEVTHAVAVDLFGMHIRTEAEQESEEEQARNTYIIFCEVGGELYATEVERPSLEYEGKLPKLRELKE